MKLFIIGNGFDRNHGCETGYDSFKKHLQIHSYMIGDFELSHYFNGLYKKLWDDFENELEYIDFEEQMSDYVADTNPDLPDRDLKLLLNNFIQHCVKQYLTLFVKQQR